MLGKLPTTAGPRFAVCRTSTPSTISPGQVSVSRRMRSWLVEHVPEYPQLFPPEAIKDLRAEVVHVLEVIGSDAAMEELAKAIDDPNRAIRLAAIRALVGCNYTQALPQVEAKVTDKEFKNADLTEKKAYLEAYGVFAGPLGIATLSEMLLPKGFMKRREDSQIRACAAMGLGKIGTPEATAVLEQAANDKDPLVRNAVNQAMRSG
ncbi:MAG: HEAT repeat domain-containing protein [Gemmatimonadetes bacterium]|nr:HEAT repeat domain-containing protein [Gemmatimonadota bacterium]